GDTLALAEMAHLLDEEGRGEWLDRSLKGTDDGATESVKPATALSAARSLLIDRTPAEALEIAITYGDVVEAAIRWGNVPQRLANLDALRGLAKTFEELCSAAKTPATPSGLIRYLHNLSLDQDFQPANPDQNGIHVLTYHRSKGLEWPFV